MADKSLYIFIIMSSITPENGDEKKVFDATEIAINEIIIYHTQAL